MVGFSALDHRNYIDLLYIHKDYQRQGVVSKLLINIEVEAKQLEQLYLTSNMSKTAKLFVL
uniref:GNAT family N-acetyltransferase n=1 Tax=Candidatus Nitrosacidococcus tergens TaxID=553981 RepID=UPI0038B94438